LDAALKAVGGMGRGQDAAALMIGDAMVEDLYLLRAQLLVARESYGDAVKVLEEIPSLALQPALVAAVYQLSRLRDGGEPTSALDGLLVASADVLSSPAVADEGKKEFSLHVTQELHSVGRSSDAAQVLQNLLRSGLLDGQERLAVTAQLALLLAGDDNEAAERLTSNLPPLSLSSELQVEELEKRELPRLARAGKTLKVHVTSGKESLRRKPRTAEQKARKKARRREGYLLKLQLLGKFEPSRPIKPDPERWIARNQRSYAKRSRKNRQKFVGGQGSGDGAQKDMLKLDAFAKAQAKKEEEAKEQEAKLKEAADGARKPPPGRGQRKKR